MIDRIAIINDHEALIIFNEGAPKRLTTSEDIHTFLGWFLTKTVTVTYGEYTSAVKNMDDTCIMEAVA